MDATIHINAAEPIGRIDPLVYGQMFENAGNCVYDGLWVGEDSAILNRRGIRTDTLDKLREVRTSIIRWPGGTPSETYHWREGVGPRGDRPSSLLAGTCWNSPGESNAFGTDEYIALCRELNCEPYICVNVGTGTAEEAANWVEYCNHDGDTPFAALRKANGHPEPFGVKYWGIGNESYWWYDDPDDYATLLHHYVKGMKLADPTIKIVASGNLIIDPPGADPVGKWEDDGSWNRTILTRCRDEIDYISTHPYWGIDGNRIKDFDDFMGCPARVERLVGRLGEMIHEFTGETRIRVALDEWQVIHEGRPDNGGIQTCTLQDALYTASFFHAMYRHCASVGMSNLCNLMNCLPAIVTDGPRMYLNPIYHAINLYANHSGPAALDAQVDVVARDDVPYLDCAATYDEQDGRLNVALINRHRTQDMACQINIRGRRPQPHGRVFELGGESELAANDFDHSDNVVLVERTIDGLGERIAYTCPAHSITVLEMTTS
jgi:alpha-N-arabinofuranosidase